MSGRLEQLYEGLRSDKATKRKVGPRSHGRAGAPPPLPPAAAACRPHPLTPRTPCRPAAGGAQVAAVHPGQPPLPARPGCCDGGAGARRQGAAGLLAGAGGGAVPPRVGRAQSLCQPQKGARRRPAPRLPPHGGAGRGGGAAVRPRPPAGPPRGRPLCPCHRSARGSRPHLCHGPRLLGSAAQPPADGSRILRGGHHAHLSRQAGRCSMHFEGLACFAAQPATHLSTHALAPPHPPCPHSYSSHFSRSRPCPCPCS